MTITAIPEDGSERVRHHVLQAYRVGSDMIEFLPVSDVPGFKHHIILNGVATRKYTKDRPSARVAVFFSELLTNGRYVHTK